MSKNKSTLTPEQNRTLKRLFIRQNWLMFGINYTRMQGISYAYIMQPFLKEIYKDDKEAYFNALKRNASFYNTNPTMSPTIQAVGIAMEEENAISEEFDENSINALKVGLMGPFAGIGDTFFSSTLRVIAAGLGLGFAQQGSILGAIIFLLAFNIPAFTMRWYGAKYGYIYGSKYIQEAIASGVLGIFTKSATIIGLMMIGAMTFTMVKFNVTFQAEIAGNTLVLQDIFDSLLPGLLPLLLTLGCFKLFKKDYSPVKLLIAIFVFAIVLTGLGITG